MFEKKFVVISLANSYPVYLTHGEAPLFDNVEVTGVGFYFSTAIQKQTVLHDSVAEAEVWIGGFLHLFPRFAPLTVCPVYVPVIMVPGETDLKGQHKSNYMAVLVREPGYYWVSCQGAGPIQGGWLIAEYCATGFWELTGIEIEFSDSDFTEIDPLPIVRKIDSQGAMDLYNGELFKNWVSDRLAINNLKINSMPVNVKAITEERLQSWSKQLVDAHATPVLLVGVGHDHVSGQIRVVVTENMTPVQIRAFLKAALKAFDK